jgi:CheY-like chemotaxis protein
MTNSAKYGALSDNGSVAVNWCLDEEGDLLIEWRERGGPAVKAPTRQGFGTTIINRSIPYDLSGRAETRYPMHGFEADFCVPARHIAFDDSTPKPPSQRVEVAAAGEAAQLRPMLSGVALLVEDSLIIAMDAEDILAQLGATRVVTASRTAQALEELAGERFEVAVLDVNLEIETSLPVADALLAAGIPYVFATGYGDQLKLPPEHAKVPVVQKPYTAGNIAWALDEVLGR